MIVGLLLKYTTMWQTDRQTALIALSRADARLKRKRTESGAKYLGSARLSNRDGYSSRLEAIVSRWIWTSYRPKCVEPLYGADKLCSFLGTAAEEISDVMCCVMATNDHCTLLHDIASVEVAAPTELHVGRYDSRVSIFECNKTADL